MAHYAKVLDGKVVNVIVADADYFDTFVDDSPGDWIKTSYNMYNGVYYDPEAEEPMTPHSDQEGMIAADEGRQRWTYANVGMIYDKERNAFYWAQPYPSWTLNTTTLIWEPPTPRPTDEEGGQYYEWDEDNLVWQSMMDID